MKTRNYLVGLTLLVAVELPFSTPAQQQSVQDVHHHYKFVEIGTFGGPNSYLAFSNRSLNNSGVAADTADTQAAVNPPLCFIDCYVIHTFLWKNGTMTDLGGLPGVAISGSQPNYINDRGVVAGIAFNGGVDEAIGVPQFDAVVWMNGKIIDLGAFGGNLSYAAAINDRNEAVGFALNATPDSYDLGDFCQTFPMTTQMRAFIWRNGVKQDLGTLGGPDSCALVINERGQVAGNSFTDSIVNPSTGVPTLHPFLWDGNQMMDLGTLGGTVAVAVGINNHEQVAGESRLVGDQTRHAFLWDKGQLTDLGSLGGQLLEAIGFNEIGELVGQAQLADLATIHAFLARKNDGNPIIIDLGPLPGNTCSVAYSINVKSQIVGSSDDCAGNNMHAFLWEHSHMLDLNALVPASSNLTLSQATFINDSGEISAQGVFPNGDQRAVLLIPCDEEHPNIAGCDYSTVDADSATQVHDTQLTSINQKLTLTEVDAKARIRTLLTNRNRRFGPRPQ
jgi:probable HAF family extracellular repeat protein